MKKKKDVKLDKVPLEDFEKLKRMSTFFPLDYRDSNFTWNTFRLECSICDREIPDEQVKGSAEHPKAEETYRFKAGSVIEDEWHVKGYGLCKRCNVLTPFDYLFCSNMQIKGYKDGKFRTWQGEGNGDKVRTSTDLDKRPRSLFQWIASLFSR